MEDLASTQEIAAKLATGAPVISFENRYRSIEGNYRTLSWTAVPEHKSSMVYAIARDITETIESNRKINELAAELKDANDMLLEQASTDPLTKLKIEGRSTQNSIVYFKSLKNSRALFLY